jgi:hypothetical protein
MRVHSRRLLALGAGLLISVGGAGLAATSALASGGGGGGGSGFQNYASNLNAAPGEGSDDPSTSARAAIIPVINGQVGAGNPNRQGLNSALRGEGDPLNVQQEIPGQGNGRYSPVWDVHPVTWTQAAIDSGQQVLLTSASQVTNAFTHSLITGGTGPANSSPGGLQAGGLISNCPIIAVS